MASRSLKRNSDLAFTALLLFVTLSVVACASVQPPPPPNIPKATPSENIEPEDEFEIWREGDNQPLARYRVAPDSTIFTPNCARVIVGGKTPTQLSQELLPCHLDAEDRRAISIKVVDRVRWVLVIGMVHKPRRVRFFEGITIKQAISRSGGVTTEAASKRVMLRRMINGKRSAFMLDISYILEEKTPDIELNEGDELFIPERVY